MKTIPLVILSQIAVAISAMANSPNPAIAVEIPSGESASAIAQDALTRNGFEWKALEENSNRYVLAERPTESSYDYRTGGWIETDGLSFFLPHDISSDQYQAIQNGLYRIPPKSNSKTAKVLQKASRITAKTVLITAAGLVTHGYMGNEGVSTISDFVDEAIYFAEE